MHQPDYTPHRGINLICIIICIAIHPTFIPSLHPMFNRTSWDGGGKISSSLLGWRGQNILITRRDFVGGMGWVVSPNVL